MHSKDILYVHEQLVLPSTVMSERGKKRTAQASDCFNSMEIFFINVVLFSSVKYWSATLITFFKNERNSTSIPNYIILHWTNNTFL